MEAVSAAAFFDQRVPDLAARNGHLVARGVDFLGAPPLAVEVDGDAWTVAAGAGRVSARRGVGSDAFVVTLTPEQFSDWAQDLRSFHAMATGQELEYRNGGDLEVSLWDSLWRALVDGWPVVDDIEFLDRSGERLDFTRVFTPDDDPADVAHFMRECGFLHLRGWLDPEQAEQIADDFDRAEPLYTEGDGRSWWARLEDGSHRCVRMQEFVQYSPTTAAVITDPRWEQLRRTLGGDDELRQSRSDTKVVEALIKPVGVVAGASNLPFHRDCHFGKHAYECSGVDVGIPVTRSGEHNGQLRVIAGSHRVAVPVAIANTTPYLPVVPLPTEPGDCTIHLGCTLHESTAPLVETRKVIYTPFSLAPRPGDAPAPVDSSALREGVYKRLLEDIA